MYVVGLGFVLTAPLPIYRSQIIIPTKAQINTTAIIFFSIKLKYVLGAQKKRFFREPTTYVLVQK